MENPADQSLENRAPLEMNFLDIYQRQFFLKTTKEETDERKEGFSLV